MQSFYTSLNTMDLLEVSGEDSRKFLQGQLTCELEEFPAGSIKLGAACNNKGRVYSNFRILHHEGRFLLSMQSGVLPDTLQILQKFIPFYKAQMNNASKQFNRIGLAGLEAENCLTNIFPELPQKNQTAILEDSILINISRHTPRYELWISKGKEGSFNPVFDTLMSRDDSAWDSLDYDAGIFLITPQESSLYTPEELNLDLAGFISFSKGCYTGQEIVARMHYRGKAGKRLYVVTFSSPQMPVKQSLFDSSNKQLGEVFHLINTEGDCYKGLVVIKTTTELKQNFWLGDEVLPLPAEISQPDYSHVIAS